MPLSPSLDFTQLNSKIISQLQPVAALKTLVSLSQHLLTLVAGLSEQDEAQLEQTQHLASLRQQLVEQTFATPWQEDAVQQHLASLQQLEQLDAQLQETATHTRQNLHQQRVDNQQGRKAVSAYGHAKNQFQR